MTTSLIKLEALSGKKLTLEMDGSLGIYREKHKPCLISAVNDFQAIECWLKEYVKSPATFRNYQKDGERLLLWSIIKRQKPLSSLTGEDLLSYSQFIEDPQPRDVWCGPKLARKGKRWTKNWRPFVTPLTQEGKVPVFKALASLFKYLTEVQYLSNNPLLSVRRQLKLGYSPKQEKKRINARIIDMNEWFAIQDILEEMPVTHEKEQWEKIRLRFLLALGYLATLRPNELATTGMNGFWKSYDIDAGKYRWWLTVIGKGNKTRDVPVNQTLLNILVEYRHYLKLSDEPQPEEQEPLIKSLHTNRVITTRRINQLIKELTAKAADYFEKLSQPEKAVRLRKFSAHWLRHLSCSVQGQLQFQKVNIKNNAGHENESTTDIYIHPFDNQRHEEMEKLTMRPIFNSPV